MDKDQIREVIAKRAAKELHDGDVVNLGIGIPTMIPNYLPEGVTDSAVTLTIYTDVFTQIGLVTLGVTVLMAVTAPLLNRLITRTDAEDAEPAMGHE